MTFAKTADSAAVDTPSLAFERTVKRGLVHRKAVSEVFLTDLQTVDDRSVLIGAQLPRCHGYFNDHARAGSWVDPLLYMEVARQATLASAHALGVPADVILISSDCALEVTDSEAFYGQHDAATLRIDSTLDWTAVRGNQPRAGICRQTISIDGRVAATYSSSGSLMSRNHMAALRSEQRESEPPWTDDMADRPHGFALPPASVGRYNPSNVVLTGFEANGSDVTAVIAPPWKNRALFDHSYDHLTMQILIEAARQLAILAIERGSGAAFADWTMTSVAGQFHRFAELDAVTSVHASLPAIEQGTLQFPVRVVQDGQEVASIDMTFSTAKGARQ